MGEAAWHQEPRLLDQVRDRIRFRHYSIRTEQAYLGWIRRFILFHGKRHPRDMGVRVVEQFLSALATEHNVVAPMQNQVFSTILFLSGEVLEIGLPWCDRVAQARRPQRLANLLT